MRWSEGEATIEHLIVERRLKRRPTFDPDLNQASFEQLDTKIHSIDLLIGAGDYETALSVAHEVVRKSLTCLLRAQGLDIDNIAGSHKTVEDSVLAQFGQPGGPLYELRFQIPDIRTLRHQGEYHSELTEVTLDDATMSRSVAVQVRDITGKLMPHLSVF